MTAVVRNGVIVLAFDNHEDRRTFIANLSRMDENCLFYAQADPSVPDAVMEEVVEYVRAEIERSKPKLTLIPGGKP